MLTIRKSKPADAEDLAICSREAFHSDALCGGPVESGPPGYDDPAWHRKIMRYGDFFTALVDEQIVGGLVIFRKGPGHYEVGRIFVHPDYQNVGIGAELFAHLWTSYPLVLRWTLGTPEWNVRTRHFYPKVGFTEMGIDAHEGVLFERRVKPNKRT